MGLDTAESISGNLAHYLALTGEPDSVNQVYALYDRLTPEDVAEAARRYFTTDARTVVTLRHQVAAGDPGAGSNA